MVVCAAAKCSNSSRIKNMRFFKFPSEEQRRKLWIENSSLPNEPGPYAKLCEVSHAFKIVSQTFICMRIAVYYFDHLINYSISLYSALTSAQSNAALVTQLPYLIGLISGDEIKYKKKT